MSQSLFPNLHIWGRGVRFFSFVAGTHPLWLKFWQPISTVPKIRVTMMKTSAIVLMLCSDGAFGCLVRQLVYLFVLFFPLQCEVTKSQSSGKGGRETGPSVTWLQ